MRDAKKHAAPGGAIELGDRDSGQSDGLVEFPGLVQRVLAGAGINHQHDLVRRRFIDFPQHPVNFLQFLHQIGLGVQSAGRIGNEYIDLSGFCRLQCVVNNGCRIGAGTLCDNRHIVAFTPRFQLLDRCCAEGIPGSQHDRQTFFFVALCQFPDGRGLAGAVDTHHQDHERFVFCIDE